MKFFVVFWRNEDAECLKREEEIKEQRNGDGRRNVGWDKRKKVAKKEGTEG
jgi:hypothetical protein